VAVAAGARKARPDTTRFQRPWTARPAHLAPARHPDAGRSWLYWPQRVRLAAWDRPL